MSGSGSGVGIYEYVMFRGQSTCKLFFVNGVLIMYFRFFFYFKSTDLGIYC